MAEWYCHALEESESKGMGPRLIYSEIERGTLSGTSGINPEIKPTGDLTYPTYEADCNGCGFDSRPPHNIVQPFKIKHYDIDPKTQ